MIVMFRHDMLVSPKPPVPELYWHCLSCGMHERVLPTGGDHQYGLGDKEPCTDCEDGTAHVVTLKMGAAYEQGLALGLDQRAAWQRAVKVGGSDE